MKAKIKLNTKIISNAIIVCLFLLVIVPFLMQGENAIIPIHDWLDSNYPALKYLKDQNLLFSINQPTSNMNGMHSLYYPIGGRNLLTFIYYLFNLFVAFQISYILKIIIGFFSMYLLLQKIFKNTIDSTIFKLIAFCFAILPTTPSWWIAMESLPLFVYLFLELKDKSKFSFLTFFMVLLPFLSNFVVVGVFAIPIWIVVTIVICIYKRKININLIIAPIFLMISYIFIDYRVFYMSLFSNDLLNRTSMAVDSSSILSTMITILFTSSVSYHAPNMQTYIVMPTILIVIYCSFTSILKKQNKIPTIKKEISYLNITQLLWQSFIITILLAFIGGLYTSSTINNIVGMIFPFLKGFNWGRVHFLSRISVYIAFSCALCLIYLRLRKGKILAYILIVAQICSMALIPSTYNMVYSTYQRDKLLQKQDYVTYNEFFSSNFFNNIKMQINYSGEGVAALGFHPSVLLYNGYTTIDGYIAAYPESTKQAFREIIAPYLDSTNQENKDYFDDWGARMYLYADDVSVTPTQNFDTQPIELKINPTAFYDYGGTYIFSRYEILNYNELKLQLFDTFTDADGIYKIYVYKIR